MKNIILEKFRYSGLLVILAMFLFSCGADPAPEINEEVAKNDALHVFKTYQETLQGELLGAIEQADAAGAVEVCKDISPEVAAELSEQENMIVRRVSDRPRNPQATPDAFEAQVLANWAALKEEGHSLEPVAEMTDVGYRVMSPIMTGAALCMQCHGGPDDIAPETEAVIDALYPDDQATGYSMNELRGAFSAIITE